MLRQMSRRVFDKDGVKFVVAEWDDCLDVLESCGAVISQTVNQYSEADIELLNSRARVLEAQNPSKKLYLKRRVFKV